MYIPGHHKFYKAVITPNKENSQTKIYHSVIETAFKFRYASHQKHLVIPNTKLIQNYQANIGISYQQTKF